MAGGGRARGATIRTGVAPARIRENLRRLSDAGAKIVLRCPIVPGLNDRPDHFRCLGQLGQSLSGVDHIEVLPYHPLGLGKAKKLDRQMGYQATTVPAAGEVAGWLRQISAHTDKAVCQA